jgi:hypothetical protein
MCEIRINTLVWDKQNNQKLYTFLNLAIVFIALAFPVWAKGPQPKPLPFILDMVHHNPGEPLFDIKYNDTAYLKSLGYTGQNPKFFVQTAVNYDALDQGVMPVGSATRVWSEKNARFIDEHIAEAKASQMPLYPFTDMLVVPKTLLDKYGDQMKINGHISILKPMTEKVVRTQVAAIFDRFPDLGGITIRFGETFLHDTPYHVGESPAQSIEEHQALIRILRDEVCVKRNKQLFYRTWSWGGINLHTNPTSYTQVTDAIEPHPKLIFSIKHTNADFMRGVPFNRTIGIGKHRQIVEVSANQAGLYGKNAHPYYIGQGVINGWEEMGERKRGLRDLVGSKQFAGVWTWTAGDGWQGPYITNTFWVDLNVWVISRFAQQPWRTEEDLFNQYAREVLKLDQTETKTFRELSLLATSATYHAQHSALFSVNPWWTRDDFLAAVNLDEVVAKNIQKEVLEEKAGAVADWKRVEALSRDIKLSNPADQEFLEVSATYGRIKIALIEQIWKMQILAAEKKRDELSGKTTIQEAYDDKKFWMAPRPDMKTALYEYDRLWAEWRKLKADHPSTPSLYKDYQSKSWGAPPGMDVTTAQYRKELSSPKLIKPNP